MKKRVAKKILKYKDRLHYTPKQIKMAERKLAQGGKPSASQQGGEHAQAE